MYLLQNPAPVNNRKWNLGRMGCGCSARGIATPPQRRISQRTVMGFLNGSVADGMIAEGYDQAIINTLSVSGATDAQLQMLWDNYGANTPEFSNAAQALLMQLSSGSVKPASPLPTPTSASPTPSTVGVPSGSTFTYTVQWASSLTNVAGPSQILATVTQALTARGISVDSNSIPATIVGQATGFTIIGHTTIARAQWADVKGDIDNVVTQAGRQRTSSNLIPGDAAAGGFDLSSFLSSYGLPIGIGVGALLLVKEL